jgi:uncharacterized membrane protein
MSNIPLWALTIAYWLHMLATIVWIGGIATIILHILPAAKEKLAPLDYASLLESIKHRLDPLAWLSLTILLGTGMFQMSANPNYEGFLTISNTWSKVILVKHVLFLCVIAVSAYLTWVLIPAQRRLALLRAKGIDTPEAERIEKRETWLQRVNLVFAIVILALTALARAS